MSTANVFLDADEIDNFVRETKIGPQYFYGYDDRELGICPYISFYVYHDEGDYVPLARKVVALYEEFGKIVDGPFELIWRDETQDWLKLGDKRLPTNLHNEWYMRHQEGRPFWVTGTDMTDPAASPRWSFSAKVRTSSMLRYSTLKLVFRYKWYADHKEQWRAFIDKCLRALQPEQCYSGFEVGNGDLSIMGSYEADVLERICADCFYGMDIDHPSTNGFQFHDDQDGWVNPTDLGSGIRTPTWCFLLSPYWQGRLGKTEVRIRAELNDPRIRITALPHPRSKINPEGHDALWIELGDLSLYPVEEGLPDLLVTANRLIKPIRCDDLNLLSLDPWSDDPNPRFDFESGPLWIARFDDDSEWPSADKRIAKPPEPPLFATTGELCPRSGLWSPRADVPLPDGFVKQGSRMPAAEWHDQQGQFRSRDIKWQLVKAAD